MKIRLTQEVELTEEQENWSKEDLLLYAKDLIDDRAINLETMDIEILED